MRTGNDLIMVSVRKDTCAFTDCKVYKTIQEKTSTDRVAEVHGEKDFTPVSTGVHACFSKCLLSKGQDFPGRSLLAFVNVRSRGRTCQKCRHVAGPAGEGPGVP